MRSDEMELVKIIGTKVNVALGKFSDKVLEKVF